jgi:four helix bundle protein
MRDHRNLKVFSMADALTIEIYRRTRSFPPEERYGLQSQIRRATVSVAANIVEGCTRPTTRDYRHFLSIALGSAKEARYLVSVANRLDMIDPQDFTALDHAYDSLVRALSGLLEALRRAPCGL